MSHYTFAGVFVCRLLSRRVYSKLVVQIISYFPQPYATGSALLALPSEVYPWLLALPVWSQSTHIDEQCARKYVDGARGQHSHCASQIINQC